MTTSLVYWIFTDSYYKAKDTTFKTKLQDREGQQQSKTYTFGPLWISTINHMYHNKEQQKPKQQMEKLQSLSGYAI